MNNTLHTLYTIREVLSTYEGLLAQLTIEAFLGERGDYLRKEWAEWKAKEAEAL